MIPRGAVRAPAAGAGLRAMSIPIDPSKAVGGRLAAGDRVDVLFTDRSVASIIVTDAKVLAVDERGRGGIGESTSPFTLTIAVDASESLLVAAAIADGNISIARTTGATSSQGTAPQTLGRTAPTTVPSGRPVIGMPVPEPAPIEPSIALVFSPEIWVEELHRHLADHGGARVRQIVMEPSVALEEEYDTLVVSHRWPALSRPLITGVHDRGRRVLGVFDPDEPQGRDHLARARRRRDHLRVVRDRRVRRGPRPTSAVAARVRPRTRLARLALVGNRSRRSVRRAPARSPRSRARPVRAPPRSRSSSLEAWPREGATRCSSTPTSRVPRSRRGSRCRPSRTCALRSTRWSTGSAT